MDPCMTIMDICTPDTSTDGIVDVSLNFRAETKFITEWIESEAQIFFWKKLARSFSSHISTTTWVSHSAPGHGWALPLPRTLQFRQSCSVSLGWSTRNELPHPSTFDWAHTGAARPRDLKTPPWPFNTQSIVAWNCWSSTATWPRTNKWYLTLELTILIIIFVYLFIFVLLSAVFGFLFIIISLVIVYLLIYYHCFFLFVFFAMYICHYLSLFFCWLFSPLSLYLSIFLIILYQVPVKFSNKFYWLMKCNHNKNLTDPIYYHHYCEFILILS